MAMSEDADCGVVEVISDDERLAEQHPEHSTLGTSASSRRPPTEFRKYRLGKPLGSGVSGQVYECTYGICSGARKFAVKAVDLAKLKMSKNAVRQHTLLRREVDILKKLPAHPNIVQMHDAFEEDQWFLFILELVLGGDLFSALTSPSPRRFSDAEAAHVLRQVVDGLSFLHGQGVIHRDLKPENVLVASQRRDKADILYEVKITDFGLSKAVGMGASMAQSRVGTPPYQAPEVRRGGEYDFSSDLWCLGVNLFVWLKGAYPFTSIPQDQDTMNRICDALSDHVCNELMFVLIGLLQLDPLARLSLSDLARLDWLRLCPGEAATPNRPSKRPRSDLGSTLEGTCGNHVTVEVETPSPTATQDMLTTPEISSDGGTAALARLASCQGVAHHYLRVAEEHRYGALVGLLENLIFDQVVVFVGTAEQATELEERLTEDGLPSVAVHADMPGAVAAVRRQRFKDLEKRVLVSTDVVEGCTDAPACDLSVSFVAAEDKYGYCFRLPQTKAFRLCGRAITFVTSSSDREMLKSVQEELGVKVTAFNVNAELVSRRLSAELA